MKAKDLAKILMENPELEVIITSSNFELNGALVPVDGVHKYDNAKKEVKTFRDAFDHETYDKEVYTIFEGDENVLIISGQ